MKLATDHGQKVFGPDRRPASRLRVLRTTLRADRLVSGPSRSRLGVERVGAAAEGLAAERPERSAHRLQPQLSGENTSQSQPSGEQASGFTLGSAVTVDGALARLRNLRRHRSQVSAPSAPGVPVTPPSAPQSRCTEVEPDSDSRRDDVAFAALGLMFLALVMI